MTHDIAVFATVLQMAKEKISLSEVRHRSRHAVHPHQGYELVMATIEDLEIQGLVRIVEGRIILGSLTRQGWLDQAILAGELDAWQIVDYFPENERKFDPDQDAQTQLGQLGEGFVVQTLFELVPNGVAHLIDQVSLRDDSAGFDIQCPINLNGDLAHLEVKTSSRNNDGLRFFLTRNEWTRARVLRNWFIVLVQVIDSEPRLFGHLPAQSLSPYLPTSQHRDFEWQVTRGMLSADDVYTGLPLRF